MNICLTLIVCLGAVWLTEARPEAPGGHHQYNRGGFSRGGYSRGGFGGSQDYEDANYNFMYEVQDAGYGVDFGHKESRSGQVAQGNYHVLLPDGRVQTVDYTADQGGYNAVVNYQGGGGAGGYGAGSGKGAGSQIGWRGGADGRFRRGGFGGHQGGFGGGFNAGH